jgi:hypothetical protein
VENAPNGFPRLAAFQASDSNFGLYRSYSYLHSRVLLDYQSEITELEEKLDQIDWDEVDEDEDRPRFRAEADENTEARRTILREIKTKLMEYGKPDRTCGNPGYSNVTCRRGSYQRAQAGDLPTAIRA